MKNNLLDEMINKLKKKLFDKINSIEETYIVDDKKLITENLTNLQTLQNI